MINNPTKLLFILTLISGTIISISANSWFGAWIGLEINLLSFIPLMTNTSNLMTTEASLKYFLTQALASATLLFTVIFSALIFSASMTLITSNIFLNTLISSSLLLKMGAAPLHFWFPGVMEGLNWMNGLMLMTWQKIAPLMLLSYNFSLNIFTSFVIVSSVMIGSLGGLNQTSLRKILAYSSINHLGWLTAALMIGENLWNLYFLVYSFLTATIIFMLHSFSLSHLNQSFSLTHVPPVIKFSLFMTFLSLGGLPPFIGFLPKWIVIQSLTNSDLKMIVFLMVVMTLITLFYYLRVGFSAFMLTYSENSWNIITNQSNLVFNSCLVLTMFSTLGLTFCSLIYHIL
uniref:NADH-ubiquinone oxidoreductase chain 2 n=1 Tax=Acroneuria carolinensis TaxID=219317 RepID=A0A7U3RWQ7_ACRCA|nr:NADH dehydrogenase subunit 2 [Acroneuria carolinensis]QOV02858.1 NADH dehydrogenase subunit 2 [Acroneuria carolinensis]